MNPPSGPADTFLLRMSGIGKSFSGIPVLADVAFDLRRGEVHVLAGENGAGKSTLMKILAGVHRDHSGTIALNGRPVRFRSPRHAADAGVAVIYQELSLVESMSVADNLHLGRETSGPAGWVNTRAQMESASSLLGSFGVELDVAHAAEEYSLALRQMLEIAKAISRQAAIVVMDEPTSALNDAEVERLFEIIRSLKERGTGIVYITHKLEEIERIGDRITVLRDGRNAGTDDVADLSRDEIIRRMVGREISSLYPYSPPFPGEEALAVHNVTVTERGGRRRLVDHVSLRVRGGEVVGLAGLQGCGSSELLRALFGCSDGAATGWMATTIHRGLVRSPADGVRAGMALLTNDRQGEGVVSGLSVGENIILASLARWSAWGWIRKGAERGEMLRQIADTKVKTTGPEQQVGELSGGNQQKVLFARWLATDPRVLLLDDPTRGVDVGAKQEIYALLGEWKRRGCAILFTSSETPELLGLADRILVMREGRIVAELSHDEASQEAVLRAALGVRRMADA